MKIILNTVRMKGFVLRILLENENEVTGETYDPPSANKIPIGQSVYLYARSLKLGTH
jgi:hypothetical protein